MAEILSDHGYLTAAFLGGPFLNPAFGLTQGFDHTSEDVTNLSGVRADALTDRALAWLSGVGSQEPFFLFVNYFDPHAPYDPPDEFDLFSHASRDSPERAELPASWWTGAINGTRPLTEAERSLLIDGYDGELRSRDHHLGRLLDAVRARDDGATTLVIVTADHGESFGEG